MSKNRKYHPSVCDYCGADLCQPNSIRVHFSDGFKETNVANSQVNENGLLADPTGQISIGMHAGSYCGECDELVEECVEE